MNICAYVVRAHLKSWTDAMNGSVESRRGRNENNSRETVELTYLEFLHLYKMYIVS